MNPENALTVVASYAPRHVQSLRETFVEVSHLVEEKPTPINVIVADPADVLAILADRRLPPLLIEAALWSCALQTRDVHNLNIPLPEKYQQVACQVANFYSLLSLCRQHPAISHGYDRFFHKLWSPGLGIPYSRSVALFLATIRRGAWSADTPESLSLAAQAVSIVEPIAKNRLGLWIARRELLDLALLCKDPERFQETQDYVAAIPNQQSFTEQVKDRLVQACADSEIPLIAIREEVVRTSKVAQLRLRRPNLQPQDVVRFVALLPDVPTCDRFVIALHSLGDPRTTFRDYVRHPKPNGYRSLHSCISIPAVGSPRFFVRTPEMDEQSLYGELCDWRHDVVDTGELTPSCPENRILIYTKNGECRIVSPHSSVADFIESEYKNRTLKRDFSRALVNGRFPLVDLDHILENGDIVEVIHDEHHSPKPKGQPARDKRAVEETERVEAAVAIPSHLSQRGCYLSFCRTCRPYPPQPIVAYLTAEDTITIHKSGCTAIRDMALSEDVTWRRSTTRASSVILEIDGWDRLGLLEDVARIISTHKVNMTKVEVDAFTNGTSHFKLHLQPDDAAVIPKIEEILAADHYVVQVRSYSVGDIPMRGHGPQGRWYGIVNPYTTRPAQSDLFFGRAEERQRLWEKLGSWSPTSVLLSGQKRIGKTSMLNRIEQDANKDRFAEWHTVYITLETWANSYTDLVTWFVFQLRDALNRERDKPDSYVARSGYDETQLNPEADIATALQKVAQMLAPRRTLVLIDEFQYVAGLEEQKTQGFLAALRQLVRESRVALFVLAASDLLPRHKRLEFIRPLHVELAHVPLGTLDLASAQDLVRKPVLASSLTYEDKVVRKLLRLTNGHPYYINLLCHDMFEQVEPVLRERGWYVLTQNDLDVALRKLLTQDNGIFDHLYEAVPNSRLVLTELARLAPKPDDHVQLDLLLQRLNSFGIGREIAADIDDLHQLHVIEADASRTSREAPSYRICLPLFQSWIEANWLSYPWQTEHSGDS